GYSRPRQHSGSQRACDRRRRAPREPPPSQVALILRVTHWSQGVGSQGHCCGCCPGVRASLDRGNWLYQRRPRRCTGGISRLLESLGRRGAPSSIKHRGADPADDVLALSTATSSTLAAPTATMRLASRSSTTSDASRTTKATWRSSSTTAPS